MTFASAILNEAKKWTDCKEDPSRPNRSVCVDKIHVYTASAVNNDPWCAQFAWMITDTVARKAGITNKLPKTSGTHYMVNNAPKNGLRVDRTPAVGAIFFYPTGSASGHVGFVAQIKDSKTVATIEGNSGDRVGFRTKTIGSDWKFIHIEEMAGDIALPLAIGGSGALILAAAVAAIYLYARKN